MRKIFFLILSILFLFNVSLANAGLLNDTTEIEGYAQNINAFNQSVSATQIIATVISVFLGLLGIIFVILIIIAGFNWMTANGDETKIEKAQKTIKAAIIGLIIIVAAYSITKFVFEKLPGGSSSGSSSVKVTDSGSF